MERPVRVLFLHPAASFGGASKSLIELVKAFPEGAVDATVICADGPVVAAFEAAGMRVLPVRGLSQWDNTLYSHYRGARWFVLLRELALLPFSVNALRLARRMGDYDVIHLNEITLLPFGRLARGMFRLPLVLHVRSLQRCEVGDYRTLWFNRKLRQVPSAVIAIDETVRRTLPADVPVNVVHNGIRVETVARPPAERRFRVAMLGVLLKLKGVYEFAEAARILVNERGVDAEFVIIGENARPLQGLKGRLLRKLDLAHDVRRDLEGFLQRHGLEGRIRLPGFVSDVQSVYRDLDLLCFPSYLNAAGRPVFEAAFFGVPSVVAVQNPPPDTIIHGETGLCIERPDPRLLADAIEFLYRNPDERVRMGMNAKSLANRNFDIERNARRVLDIYHEVLGKQSGDCDRATGA